MAILLWLTVFFSCFLSSEAAIRPADKINGTAYVGKPQLPKAQNCALYNLWKQFNGFAPQWTNNCSRNMLDFCDVDLITMDVLPYGCSIHWGNPVPTLKLSWTLLRQSTNVWVVKQVSFFGIRFRRGRERDMLLFNDSHFQLPTLTRIHLENCTTNSSLLIKPGLEVLYLRKLPDSRFVPGLFESNPLEVILEDVPYNYSTPPWGRFNNDVGFRGVMSLRMIGRSFSGILPSLDSKFPSLKSLILSQTGFTCGTDHPNCIFPSTLTTLSISDCPRIRLYRMPRGLGLNLLQTLVFRGSGRGWSSDEREKAGGFFGQLILSTRTLAIVDISNNKFAGKLPSFQNTSLVSLQISLNRFNGPLPKLPRTIQAVDFSYNLFAGSIWNMFNCTTLMSQKTPLVPHIFAKRQAPPNPFVINNNVGLIDNTNCAIFSNLTTLRLSYNNLAGALNSSFWNYLPSIQFLFVDNNNFDGRLPLYGLRGLRNIDASFNDFNDLFISEGICSNYTSCRVIGNRFTSEPDFEANPTLQFYPQDENECFNITKTTKTPLCPANSWCSDGWDPKLSYTCDCLDGYSRDKLSSEEAKSPLINGCRSVCGDRLVTKEEQCDGQLGCSTNCTILRGWNCTKKQIQKTPWLWNATCFPVCGDKLMVGDEQCDTDIDKQQILNTADWSVISAWLDARGFQKYFPLILQKVRNDNVPFKEWNFTKIGTIGTYLRKIATTLPQRCVNCTISGNWTYAQGTGLTPPKPGTFSRPTRFYDINECDLNPPCSISQCINLPGSFHCCPKGYQKNLDETDCEDFDECPTSANDCPRTQLCINTPYDPLTKRGFYCCNASNGETRLIGSDNKYFCGPCRGDFQTPIISERPFPFPSLRRFVGNLTNFSWMSCSDCTNGVRLKVAPIYGSPCSLPSTQTESCSFACAGEYDFITTADASITILAKEFSKAGFFSELVWELFRVRLRISGTKKRANSTSTLSMVMQPNDGPSCVAPPNLTDVIYALAFDIVPNAPTLTLSFTGCNLQASATDPNGTQQSILGPVLGAILGVAVLLVIIAIILHKRSGQSQLKRLPEKIQWSYRLYEDDYLKTGWDYRGTKKSGFYFKDFENGSTEYQKIKSEIFDSLLGGSKMMNGKGLSISKITVVYNQTLLNNFIGTYLIMANRTETSKLFNKQQWRQTATADLNNRMFVHERYLALAKACPWNNDEGTTAIVPALHGTDISVANSISENGFANLSSLDAGFYGKGIYFTSHALYSLPYIAARRQPALIISWILPGNVYPVTENHQATGSLLGQATKNGYNSHYIITLPNGMPPKDYQDPGLTLYDEWMIPQESQIVPAFILELANDKTFSSLCSDWAKQAR